MNFTCFPDPGMKNLGRRWMRTFVYLLCKIGKSSKITEKSGQVVFVLINCNVCHGDKQFIQICQTVNCGLNSDHTKPLFIEYFVWQVYMKWCRSIPNLTVCVVVVVLHIRKEVNQPYVLSVHRTSLSFRRFLWELAPRVLLVNLQ